MAARCFLAPLGRLVVAALLVLWLVPVAATGATSAAHGGGAGSAAAGRVVPALRPIAQAPSHPPHVRVTPSSVAAGSTVSVHGHGFLPGEAIQLVLATADGAAAAGVVLGYLNADSTGAFEVPAVPIPDTISPGSYALAAVGTTSGLSADAVLGVAAGPADTDSPTPIPTASETPTDVPSATPTDIPSDTPTLPPSASATMPSSDTPTTVPSATATATEPATATDAPSSTPVATSTGVPSSTPSPNRASLVAPSATPTAGLIIVAPVGPSATLTGTPVAAATATATETPSLTPVAAESGAPVVSGQTVALLSPTNAAAGDTVSVSGSGFWPDEQVDIQLWVGDSGEGSVRLTTVQAGGSGSFAARAVPIPADTPSGSYRIAALGLSSRGVAEAALTVRSIAAALNVEPGVISPAQTLRLSGAHFIAGEPVVLALSAASGASTVPLGQVQASGSGDFGPVTLRVPFGVVGGGQQVTATGQTSNRQATADVTVDSVAPTLAIDLAVARPGEPIRAQGIHFQPGEVISIDLVTLSGSIHLADSQGDANGAFSSGPLMVPGIAPEGALSVVATGIASHLSAVAQLQILAPAVTLVVSRQVLSAGESLDASGRGFIPGEALALQLTGGSLATLTLATVIASDSGSFEARGLSVPPIVPSGRYVLAVTGQTSGRATAQVLRVQRPTARGAQLGVVPPGQIGSAGFQANPGGLVQVIGSHFAAGSQVEIQLVGGTVAAASAVSSSGSQHHGLPVAVDGAGAAGFAYHSPMARTQLAVRTLAVVAADSRGGIGPLGLMLPGSLPSGYYAVKAVVTGRTVAATSLRVQTLAPALAVSRDTVIPGTIIGVKGSHFAAGEQIVLALNGAALTTEPGNIVADARGTFAASFAAPAAMLAGDNTLTAAGASSRASASATVKARGQMATHWYFADGNTTAGYRTLLSLLNPTDAPAHVRMTFLYQAAPERRYLAIVPAHAHSTVDLGLAAGGNRHMSTILEADRHIGAQSITYFGSHLVGAVIGASAPSTTSYLAEGYTGGTFREYLSIMNPNLGYATADVRFLPFNGRPPREERFVIHPRATILVDARRYMPLQSFSTIVTSNIGIVVERTMRFGRAGYAAHELIGGAAPSTVWLFAQQQSAIDRQTFLTVLNPSPAVPVAVTATFMGANGQPLGSRTIVVNPLHRGNIKLNDVLPQAEVATIVTSSQPVVVESSQYIGPAAANLDYAHSGSVQPGGNGGGNSWIFAHVRTDHGYQAQLYVFNAGAAAIRIMATAYTDRGVMRRQRLAVPPFGYGLLNLNALVGQPAGTSGVLLTGAPGQTFVPQEVQYNTALQDVIDLQGSP